jgi:pilus assembly protein CpaF
MKLSERLREANGSDPIAAPIATATDPRSTIKQRVQEGLYASLGARLYDAAVSEEQLRALVMSELAELLAEEHVPLSPDERSSLVEEIASDVLGLGPLEQFLADPDVTEVMANGTRSIYVERSGRLHDTGVRFVAEDHLRRVIERIVSRVGRRVDESSPMVDARLPDGSRVNAVIPPLAVDGPSLTIRKFARDKWQAEDLIRFGTLTPEMAELLRLCVLGRRNILVSGGTGSGKTTMLNVLSSFIPEDERIVTIEDAVELQLQQEHLVRLESRPANIEGKGSVEIRDLVRNALRMRPDRIIVGEVRGGEALDMLASMNTGHDGSLSTVHANAPREAVSRLETMVLMAGLDLPARAIREQIAAAIDLVVHVSRLRDGSRRVTHVTEVVGMEGEVVTLQDLYRFDFGAGVDDDGHFRGVAQPTGLRPRFSEELADHGFPIPAALLGAEPPAVARR